MKWRMITLVKFLKGRKAKAIELAASTFEDLVAVRGEAERIWASVLKEAIKRRNPGFNESYFGYRTFGALLEDAAQRGLLAVARDEKSNAYVTRTAAKPVAAVVADVGTGETPATETTSEGSAKPKRASRGARKPAPKREAAGEVSSPDVSAEKPAPKRKPAAKKAARPKKADAATE